jgi:plastocyanin
MRPRARAGALAAIALSFAMAAAPARAVVGLAVPGSENQGFATPVIVVPHGQTATFVNADIASYFHNLWSTKAFGGTRPPSYAKWCTGFARGTCPTFWTETVAGGQVTPVAGVERLAVGEYPFYCSLHGSMAGKLIVQ